MPLELIRSDEIGAADLIRAACIGQYRVNTFFVKNNLKKGHFYTQIITGIIILH